MLPIGIPIIGCPIAPGYGIPGNPSPEADADSDCTKLLVDVGSVISFDFSADVVIYTVFASVLSALPWFMLPS